jgi:hypothetical protein
MPGRNGATAAYMRRATTPPSALQAGSAAFQLDQFSAEFIEQTVEALRRGS